MKTICKNWNDTDKTNLGPGERMASKTSRRVSTLSQILFPHVHAQNIVRIWK